MSKSRLSKNTVVRLTSKFSWALVSAAAIVGHWASAAQPAAPQPTTPAFVTLIEVVRENNASQPNVLWLRPGDKDGRTLFAYEKDSPSKPRCVGSCATEFPPLIAPPNAKAFGDWSLVKSSKGKQWAYQGKPLYTWTKEQIPGEVATNVALQDRSGFKVSEVAASAVGLLPPEDWAVVRFTPSATIKMPDGVNVAVLYSHQSVSLVTHNGMTLYQYSGDLALDGQLCEDANCSPTWEPLYAPTLAVPTGDFSIVRRADGSRQWAYQAKPLFTYRGDKLPGDIKGSKADGRWAVAMLSKNFQPANASVRTLEAYGDTMVADDMTLYGGYAFGKRWGGRNLRDTFKDAYHKGKKLGGTACDSEQCSKNWKPFLAPEGAEYGGFWEVIARPDGSRQWAYKGFAMYTFYGDSKPGDLLGHALYDFKKPEGSSDYLRKVAFYESVGKASGGAGIYWHIAKP
jgi:predicted lipoprotein with Yx(FWY)xxD motif